MPSHQRIPVTADNTGRYKRGPFLILASKIANWTGSAGAFLLAATTIMIWAILGPIFDYSDTWQLVINTSTTIITFLMVFLIQNTQNRDTKALHLKLDELIRATKGAHTVLLDMEELSDEELNDLRQKYEDIAAEGRKRIQAGKKDTNVPEVILKQ